MKVESRTQAAVDASSVKFHVSLGLLTVAVTAITLILAWVAVRARAF